MRQSDQRLSSLLPGVYRQEANTQLPLNALLAAVEGQLSALERDIERLYDNQFIETCEPWAIAYLGDLVSEVPGAANSAERSAIARREVANATRFRRRRGTLSALEELASDVLELPVRALELRERVAFTQRAGQALAGHGRAFRVGDRLDPNAFAGGPRSVALGRSSPAALRSVALLVSCRRLQLVECALVSATAGRFVFAGRDTPLFQRPRDVRRDPPIPLRRRDAVTEHYGVQASFALWEASSGAPALVGVERIRFANLTHWQATPTIEEVVVDPELGRLVSGRALSQASFHHALPVGMGRETSGVRPRWVSAGDTLQLSESGELRRATLVPSAAPSIVVGNNVRRLAIQESIVGRIVVEAGRKTPLELTLNDSVWDAGGEQRPALSSSSEAEHALVDLDLRRCTVIGQLASGGNVALSSSIVCGGVVAAGATVYDHSYVADGRPAPRLVSHSFGTAGYARLSCRCADSILRGAPDGGELGAGHGQMLHERLSRLRERIDQFVPAGWSVEVFLCDAVGGIPEQAQ